MKNLILTTAFLAFALNSCADKQEIASNQPESNVMIPEPQVAAPAETAAKTEAATSEADGEKLLAGMDCLSCHKVDAKLVGPSYQDVAAKYSEADLDMLAQKVIEGGKGNWGEIPMAPHAGLSKDNAQKMVRYILWLKK